MKRIEHLFYLLVLIGATVSCDPAEKYKAEISEMDSCIAVIEDLETKLDGINFDSLMIMVDHVKHNEALLKQYYHPDTLDEHFGRLMNECKGIRKKMPELQGKEMKFGDELNAIKHQFMDLKTDAANGVYSDEKLRDYINKEKADLQIVESIFIEFYETQKQQSLIYYTDVPEVDAYIENLMAKNDSIPE